MGSEWLEVSLGDIFNVKHGFAFKGKFFTDEKKKTILVTPGNFAIGGGFQNSKPKYYDGEIPEEYVLKPGQIIVTMTDLSKQADTLGYSAVVPDDGNIWLHNQRIGLLEFKESFYSDPIFINYLLRTHNYRSWIIGSASGTTVKHTSPNRIHSFKCKLPPLPEQSAISHILGSLDDKIELNRQMNETLESMARAIFKSWFVDFDPVHAKAEGRDTGLPEEIAALFPDSFQDSELGRIPRGWVISTVEAIAEKVACGPFGSSIKVSTFVNKGIPVISGKHLHGIRLSDTENNCITTEHAEKLKNANVYRGDVIFTHAGNIGQVAFIPETSKHERYVLSQRQFYLRCNREKMSPLFMAHYFKSSEGQHKLLANTSSTGVPSISRPVSYLKSIKLAIPPKKLIDRFDLYTRPLHELAAKMEDESNTIVNLRDTLLPKLISGELRVPDTEKFIEEAGL